MKKRVCTITGHAIMHPGWGGGRVATEKESGTAPSFTPMLVTTRSHTPIRLEWIPHRIALTRLRQLKLSQSSPRAAATEISLGRKVAGYAPSRSTGTTTVCTPSAAAAATATAAAAATAAGYSGTDDCRAPRRTATHQRLHFCSRRICDREARNEREGSDRDTKSWGKNSTGFSGSVGVQAAVRQSLSAPFTGPTAKTEYGWDVGGVLGATHGLNDSSRSLAFFGATARFGRGTDFEHSVSLGVRLRQL